MREGKILERNVRSMLYCANMAFQEAKADEYVFFFPPYKETGALLHLHFVPLFFENAVKVFGEEYVLRELSLGFEHKLKNVKAFKRAYQKHLEEHPGKETEAAIAAAFEAFDILERALKANRHYKKPRR